jgi:hypothetical protein
VFEDGKERLFKHLRINVPIWDERDGEQWNVCCEGVLTIDRNTSTAIITGSNGSSKGEKNGHD